MGNKRNASVGMFYLYTMLVVTIIIILTSCNNETNLETNDSPTIDSTSIVDKFTPVEIIVN